MPSARKLNELFSEFILECKFTNRLTPASIRGYSAVFELFKRIFPDIEYPQQVSTTLVIQFFELLQTRERMVGKDAYTQGVKASTIKTYWSKLSSFFQWVHRKAIITENPLRNIAPPKASFDDIKVLTNLEVRTIYSAIILHSANGFLLRRNTALFSLFYFTGIRLNECLSLEIRDIDFERNLLEVRSTTSKTKKQRYIPIHHTLALHLKDYLSERKKRNYKTPYLLTSSILDRGLTKHGLKHWVANLTAMSGVKFHVHQLRHTFACNLAMKNVNAAKIQLLLGHSSLNMTMSYLRSIQPSDLKSDIELLFV